MKTIRAGLIYCAVLAILSAGAWASGSKPAPKSPSAEKSGEQQAKEHYNAGLRLRDKAWRLEEKAAAAEGEEKAKLESKVMKQYVNAVKEFEQAVAKSPRFHEAYSGLGYASRKSGDYEAAIQAYDKALTLAPDYSEAIEYRGEAYLGLARLDDAKQAYLRLFSLDRPKADELLEAMQSWVAKRKQAPEGMDATSLDDFAGWVEKRAQLAGQTADLSRHQGGDW